MFRFSNIFYEDTYDFISPPCNSYYHANYLDFNSNYESAPLDLTNYNRNNYQQGELTGFFL